MEPWEGGLTTTVTVKSPSLLANARGVNRCNLGSCSACLPLRGGSIRRLLTCSLTYNGEVEREASRGQEGGSSLTEVRLHRPLPEKQQWLQATQEQTNSVSAVEATFVAPSLNDHVGMFGSTDTLQSQLLAHLHKPSSHVRTLSRAYPRRYSKEYKQPNEYCSGTFICTTVENRLLLFVMAQSNNKLRCTLQQVTHFGTMFHRYGTVCAFLLRVAQVALHISTGKHSTLAC
jgi:hypothetical protein